jgi:AhpC/TSA family
MRWLTASAFMMLVGLPALWAGDDVKEKPKEPEKSKVAEEVDALIAAYQKAESDYHQNLQEKWKNAKNVKERAKISQNEPSPKPDETREKLWALVEKNPNDKEAALPALQWLLRHYGFDDKGQERRARVLDILIKDHADDPKIGPLLDSFINIYSAKEEELIRAVMAKNPARAARGNASLSLGRYLMRLAEVVRLLKANPEESKRLETYLDKETLSKLKDSDADTLTKEAEAVFEEAAAKYGDVVWYMSEYYKKNITIADQVNRELFVIRNLAVGKTAPDIVGDDLDGKPFKLSDYRGKVVVLDFWGNWCGHCIGMYPNERSLVKRLDDMPFALVGVNSDTDKAELKKSDGKATHHLALVLERPRRHARPDLRKMERHQLADHLRRRCQGNDPLQECSRRSHGQGR